jgi:hypothetical protein
MVAAHTAPHPARHALQSTGTGPPASGAACCLAPLTHSHSVDLRPGRVAGFNISVASHLPRRLALASTSRLARASVAVDLRGDHGWVSPSAVLADLPTRPTSVEVSVSGISWYQLPTCIC